MVKINLIVIGNAGTGKTSLVECYKQLEDDNPNGENSNFSHQYMPTLGVNLVQKDIMLQDNKIKLCIWDTAGQEKFFSLTKQYFRQADGVILVFDITDKESYDKVKNYWIEQVNDGSDQQVQKILIGNKSDLHDDRQVSVIQAHELAEQYDMKYFETSSLTNDYVLQSFNHLAQLCHKQIESDIIDDPPLVITQEEPKKSKIDKIKSLVSSCFS